MSDLSFDEQVLVQTGEYLALAEIVIYVLPIFVGVFLAYVLPFLLVLTVLPFLGVFWYAFMHFTIYRFSAWLFPYVNVLARKEVEWRTGKP